MARGYSQGRFMNRVANMNPERRLKKLMSDRYENMSEERRIKKKEVWTSSCFLNCYVSANILGILFELLNEFYVQQTNTMHVLPFALLSTLRAIAY